MWSKPVLTIPYANSKQEQMLLACSRGDHVRLFQLIVDEDVSVVFRKKTESGDMTVILAAVENCKESVLTVFVTIFEMGLLPCVIVDFRGRQGQSALYRACVMGNTAAVLALRSMGARFLLRTDSNSTVLAGAAVPVENKTKQDSEQICQIIIEHVTGLAEGDSFVRDSVEILRSKGFGEQADAVHARYTSFCKLLPRLEPLEGREELAQVAQRLGQGPGSMVSPNVPLVRTGPSKNPFWGGLKPMAPFSRLPPKDKVDP